MAPLFASLGFFVVRARLTRLKIEIAPMKKNKAGYTATEVACGWVGAIFEVTGPFGQEQ